MDTYNIHMIIPKYLPPELNGDNKYPFLNSPERKLLNIYRYPKSDDMYISVDDWSFGIGCPMLGTYAIGENLSGQTYNKIIEYVGCVLLLVLGKYASDYKDKNVTDCELYHEMFYYQKMHDKIESIIEINSKDGLVKKSVFDMFEDEHCPMFYLKYIDDDVYYKNSMVYRRKIYFSESPKQAYSKCLDKFLAIKIPSDYDKAAKVLKDIYDIYATDDCIDDFWKGYIKYKIVFNKNITVKNDVIIEDDVITINKKLYYDDKEILL